MTKIAPVLHAQKSIRHKKTSPFEEKFLTHYSIGIRIATIVPFPITESIEIPYDSPKYNFIRWSTFSMPTPPNLTPCFFELFVSKPTPSSSIISSM